MPRERFILRPKPGYSYKEIDPAYGGNPNEDNAWIFAYRDGKLIDEPLDATPRLLRAAKKKDLTYPSDYKKEDVSETEGRRVWEAPPRRKLGRNHNPYRQFIYRIVYHGGDGTTLEDIYRGLLHDERAIKPDWYGKVESLVEKMEDEGLLIPSDGGYSLGIRLRLGKPYVSYRQGYDPRQDKIVEYVSGMGRAGYGEIVEHLHERLGWAEPATVSKLVESLVERGVLEKVSGGLYRKADNLKPFNT